MREDLYMDETAAIGLFNDIQEEKRKEDFVNFCLQEHKKAFEQWNEGEIVEYWEEDEGVMCVKYESGKWWHYRNNNKISTETGEPCLEWW